LAPKGKRVATEPSPARARTVAIRRSPRTRRQDQPDTTVHLLDLQRTAGNQAVQQLIRGTQGDTFLRRAPTTAAAATDAEGNSLKTDGGHQYLTSIPADCKWHKGKPEALPANPKATYNDLHKRCEVIRNEQLVLAMSLRGDMKYWFAKVYHFVTKHELMQVDAGVYSYPLMKMQEVIAFHATYEQNLSNWLSNNKSKVESNWRSAFEAAEGAERWWRTAALEIKQALLPSMQAHIRFDLPRAIAACFERYYQGIPGLSLGDFEPDFDAMGPVFDAASADLQPEIDEAVTWVSPHLRVDPTNWHFAQELGFAFAFPIEMEREHSWEKAHDIVAAHGGGINDQQRMQKRLKASSTVAHPYSGSDDFEVDGDDIDDYDWNTQPK
jgi:hypothetical protein